MTSGKLRNFILNLALISTSVGVGLVIIDVLLRFLFPFATFGSGQELPWFREGPSLPLVSLDPTLGFRPTLQNGIYDENGILSVNSFVSSYEKPSVILFIGDSVTARGRIISSIHKAVDNKSVTYLNGGVEAYNIQQEVEFFFRYQAQAKPDHIIQILHVNDLQSTPIAYRDDRGRLNVYAINATRENLNVWLFQNSHIYRSLVTLMVPRLDINDLTDQATLSLLRMREYARNKGISYEIAVFPILAPYRDWSTQERDAHRILMQAAKDLGLDPVDLLPVSELLHSNGVDILEKRDDYWHPNDVFADATASLLVQALPSLWTLRKSAKHD